MLRHNSRMLRRVPSSLLALAFALVGCGGAGQQTSNAMAPVDPTVRSAPTGSANKAESVFKPAAGVNSALGALKPMADTNPLAKPSTGKADADATAKLAKLGKDAVKLDNAYSYLVVGDDAPKTTVGEKGAPVPFPTDAKANPDGSVWIVDADARRVYTLTAIKREEGKPPVVGAETNADLVHPAADAAAPPLALAARADEATTEIKHALQITVKGLGGEGAPADGTRVRLKKDYSDKKASLLAKSVIRALKKYGAVLVPGEGTPAVTALTDPRWTKEDEASFSSLHMSDFEVPQSPKASAKVQKTGK